MPIQYLYPESGINNSSSPTHFPMFGDGYWEDDFSRDFSVVGQLPIDEGVSTSDLYLLKNKGSQTLTDGQGYQGLGTHLWRLGSFVTPIWVHPEDVKLNIRYRHNYVTHSGLHIVWSVSSRAYDALNDYMPIAQQTGKDYYSSPGVFVDQTVESELNYVDMDWYENEDIYDNRIDLSRSHFTVFIGTRTDEVNPLSIEIDALEFIVSGEYQPSKYYNVPLSLNGAALRDYCVKTDRHGMFVNTIQPAVNISRPHWEPNTRFQGYVSGQVTPSGLFDLGFFKCNEGQGNILRPVQQNMAISGVFHYGQPQWFNYYKGSYSNPSLSPIVDIAPVITSGNSANVPVEFNSGIFHNKSHYSVYFDCIVPRAYGGNIFGIGNVNNNSDYAFMIQKPSLQTTSNNYQVRSPSDTINGQFAAANLIGYNRLTGLCVYASGALKVYMLNDTFRNNSDITFLHNITTLGIPQSSGHHKPVFFKRFSNVNPIESGILNEVGFSSRELTSDEVYDFLSFRFGYNRHLYGNYDTYHRLLNDDTNNSPSGDGSYLQYQFDSVYNPSGIHDYTVYTTKKAETLEEFGDSFTWKSWVSHNTNHPSGARMSLLWSKYPYYTSNPSDIIWSGTTYIPSGNYQYINITADSHNTLTAQQFNYDYRNYLASVYVPQSSYLILDIEYPSGYFQPFYGDLKIHSCELCGTASFSPLSVATGIPLYISGGYAHNSGICDLFIRGGIADQMTLYLHQTDVFISGNNGIPLHINGSIGSGIINTIPLFIHGDLPSNSSIPLHTISALHSSGDIPLYIRGGIAADMPLFIKSIDPSINSGTVPFYMWSTLNSGLYEDISMFIEGNRIPTGTMSLYINGKETTSRTATMPLFLNYDNTHDGNIPLFIMNEYSGVNNNTSLFLQAPSGTEGAIVNSGTMSLFIARGNDKIAHNTSLYIGGPITANNAIDMFLHAQPNIRTEVSLFISGIDPIDRGITLYSHGY